MRGLLPAATVVLFIIAAAASAQNVPHRGDPRQGRSLAVQKCDACHIVALGQQIRPLVPHYAPSFYDVANKPGTTAESYTVHGLHGELRFTIATTGARQMLAPFVIAHQPEISLSPAALPFYTLRTVMRMLVALILSLIFTFTYAALAGKNRRAEMVLIPLLDVLQSVLQQQQAELDPAASSPAFNCQQYAECSPLSSSADARQALPVIAGTGQHQSRIVITCCHVSGSTGGLRWWRQGRFLGSGPRPRPRCRAADRPAGAEAGRGAGRRALKRKRTRSSVSPSAALAVPANRAYCPDRRLHSV